METSVKKNQTANVGKYSYKYVDIAQIHAYLEESGIRYYQYIDTVDGNDYVVTVPIVDGKELAPRRGCRVVDATLVGVDNPAQEQGSALTYARRYSLLMAFGLATEDDDAQSLSKSLSQEKKATPKQVEMLKRNYQGENLEKLLKTNNIEKVEDIGMQKASDLITKIIERSKKNESV